ncbi:ligand-gated channel [Loktanella sp. S4079]|nr:ligand-gated channel [Loktanella sp. S4079]
MLVGQAAVAQDDAFLGTIQLGESKREVQTDTAVPVTVVDQEEINDRQAGTIAQLVDSVPGVSLINGSRAQGSGINIRGYGANATFGTDQKVAIMVDGASVGSQELYRIGTQLFTDPELYKSVSVIRGTVGTFALGSGIVGGAVLLDTKDASDFTGGEVGFGARQTLQYSSNGDGLVSSTILAWQPTENVEFLGNYTLRKLGTQTDGDGAEIMPEAGSTEEPSGLFKGRFSFGESNEHAVTLSYSETTAEALNVPYDTFSGNPSFGYANREIYTEASALTYEYNPLDNALVDLEVLLTYSDQDIQSEYVSGAPFVIDLLNADHRYEETKLKVSNTSIFGSGAVEHNLQAGLELIKTERRTASSAPGGTEDVVALFVVDDINIGDNLTITPALRAETSHIVADQAFLDQQLATYPDWDTGPYDNEAVMGGLSARYAFDNGWGVFGSAAYTENLPIIDDLENPRGNTSDYPIYIYQSEKSETFELGASFDSMDVISDGDSLAFKATAYQTTLWDVTSYSGIERVETKGLEIEASYSMSNGFYVDANANIVEGEPFGASPETIWRGTPADGINLTVGKKFDEVLDLSFETIASAKLDETDSYVINNLRATYTPQNGILNGTEVRVGIENAFDVAYQSRLSSNPAPGRDIKLTLARTF